MKRFILNLLWASLLFGVVSCGAQNLTPPAKAQNADGSFTAEGIAYDIQVEVSNMEDYYPREVSFTDTVTSTHESKEGQLYLNFGGEYPNQSLTVWMPKSYVRKGVAAWFKTLKGKEITVTGNRGLYKDKPQVVVHKVTQIKQTGFQTANR